MNTTIVTDDRRKILVIGSSNTDMVVTADRLPVAGETLMGNSFVINGGGKGANQAVAAARLGASVVFVCKVGNDVFGRQAMDAFKAEGMVTDHVLTDAEAPSGVALITVDAAGQNQIVVAPGANARLLPADLAGLEPVIGDADIILLQLEIPLQTVAYITDLASRMGKRIILNPAPAVSIPGEVLRNISVLTPNETEAGVITEITVVDGRSARAAAEAIAARGVPHVVITRGSAGVLVLSDGRLAEIPAPVVEAVDTTAAGDVFNGALAVALAEGRPLADAARWAVAAAALSVTRRGAQASAPYRRELGPLGSTTNL